MEKVLENIVEAASERFMQLGIRSVSMDELSADLGISKKTLYKAINNKEELVDLVITQKIAEEKSLFSHISSYSINAVDEMTQIAKYAITMFSTIRPTVIHDLQKYYHASWEKVLQLQSTFIKDQIEVNLKRGIEEGSYRANIDPNVVAELYVVKAKSLTNQALLKLNNKDRENFITQHMLYHIHGILSEAGREQFKMNKNLKSEHTF